ncbi:MAG TPA: quinolinate synthase NadA [Bryobacteraceae bacterium]|jgi:quinolinate synthase|nr:quinolinate synthase NadA [Bryobacteraceae bacterium]
MPVACDLVGEILEWKAKRNAVILAHHYQDSEIQELADHIGDSLELAQAARNSSAAVIALCGVRFMAETAKILNPGKTVVFPDRHAGCSLVDSCPVEGVRAFRRRHPDHVVVTHINTSAQVKAESDILCTSRNAVAVVNSVPAKQAILFLPDANLGAYVQKQTGRKNMQVWQGACIVHATFPARRLTALRTEYPEALVAAHPECPADVLRNAHFVGSTSEIVNWCRRQSADEFIVVTESGIRYTLERNSPGKRFYFLANQSCNCSECPYTRLNTLEKLHAALETLEPCIELPAAILERARIPIDRMLAIV